MSFGYAVGDVIAVLGLFERIAIELRNYKDAPVHFQQLRAELDLVHSTLKHVLSLEPDSEDEIQTLEQIRAIVMHCSQPLQVMVNKMRSKESSLGHFRSTRSLGGIGERLHWSMIAQGDVDSVRKTIMSQMAAINILMSVQQLTRVKHLSLQSKRIVDDQSSIIEKHANAIVGHSSNILNMVSRTQVAINTLRVNAAIQADIQSKRANSINQHLTGIEKNMLHLTQKTDKASAIVRRHAGFVTRHAKILYSHMQDLKALFTLLTKCSKEMLDAIGRNTRSLLEISGQLKQILKAIEAIPLHLTLDIVRLDDAHGESWALPLQACRTWDVQDDTWSSLIKPGFHIEQAMVVEGVRSLETCPDPKCLGKLAEEVLEYGRRKACTTCGRWLTTSRAQSSLVVLYEEQSSPTAIGESSEGSRNTKAKFGPRLPSMDVKDDPESFRRVKVVYPTEPVRNLEDALKQLDENPNLPEANAFVGLEMLRDAEETSIIEFAQKSIDSLKIAIESDSSNAEYCCAQYDDGTDAFERCDELIPGLHEVSSRLEAYQDYLHDSNEELFRNHLIQDPIETPLQTHYEMADQAESEDINFNSILDDGVQESEGSDEQIDHL
ncbi:hypothetical protein FCULG_00002822 [Fusarium culmorum]|uniref:Fungal N-terminal domain-containing protein n=1 Tax=Fusarium culmorum TaxID=5516 RepID=A0A2T4H696_FUSCU|nr:hypothetical protein FCULG_00002822 [Fusarium culmorum]